MRQVFILLCFAMLYTTTSYAQITVEEINNRLDIQPYFDLGLEYESNITLPDSIKMKIIKALDRDLPRHFADSIFILPNAVIKNIEKDAWQQCKGDTSRYKKIYEEYYTMNLQSRKDYYYNQCYSRDLILACGSWNITEAIPYLEKEFENEKCEYLQKYIKVALAKLGNASIYQQIKESRSLSYFISHTKFNIGDSKVVITENIGNSYSYGLNDFLANYFKDKSFLYDMFDLLHLRGQVPFIGSDYTSIEVSLLIDFSFSLFQNNPNVNNWRDLCDFYLDVYIDAKKIKNSMNKFLPMLISKR